MNKFKVGDKVRVKDHSVDVGPGWVLSMDRFCGKIVTIIGIPRDGLYEIKESCFLFCDDMFQGLSTGNEIIDLLMKKLGVEIDEEFEIEKGNFNPYHFDKSGYIINSDGDISDIWFECLVHGTATIKKIPKLEIKEMTVVELEESLGLPKGTLRVKGGE